MRVLALAFVSGVFGFLNKEKVPITETVSVEGTEIYGQTAGHSTVNQCQQFARQFVDDAAKPAVKVCGTSTKAIVYLRNRCEEYHKYTEEIGVCDTSADSSTCKEASPATQNWMATAQSFKIVPC